MPPTTSRSACRSSTRWSASCWAASWRRRSASLFGIPSLRIKGFYLACATLAAQFFGDWAFLRIKWITNYTPSGSVNAPPIQLFGFDLSSPTATYIVALAFTLVLGLAAKNMVRGHIGRQWMAIRDMDIAAEIIGVRPMYAKLTAFAVSSFLIGVAGAMWAFLYLGSWEPAAFSIDRSFQLMFMVIIGGLGSILGSVLGAVFIVAAADLPQPGAAALGALVGWKISTATVSHFEAMIFGALIVFFLVVEPHGLARLWSIAKEKLGFGPSRTECETLAFRQSRHNEEETHATQENGRDGCRGAGRRHDRRRDRYRRRTSSSSRAWSIAPAPMRRTASRSPTASPTTSP